MSDAPPFKRGDVVIVNMAGLDNHELAIVSHVSSSEIGVCWIMHRNNHDRYYGHAVGADCMFWPPEYQYIQKVGHIKVDRD